MILLYFQNQINMRLSRKCASPNAMSAGPVSAVSILRPSKDTCLPIVKCQALGFIHIASELTAWPCSYLVTLAIHLTSAFQLLKL